MKTLFYLIIPKNKIYHFFNIKQLGHKVLTIRIVSDSSVSLNQSKVQRVPFQIRHFRNGGTLKGSDWQCMVVKESMQCCGQIL